MPPIWKITMLNDMDYFIAWQRPVFCYDKHGKATGYLNIHCGEIWLNSIRKIEITWGSGWMTLYDVPHGGWERLP